VVERTAKRTTRSTNSAAVPTGRDGSRWIPKKWTVAEFAPVHKLTAFLTPTGRVLFLRRLAYQDQPHSFLTRSGIVDVMLPGICHSAINSHSSAILSSGPGIVGCHETVMNPRYGVAF
jgi:hypothetical protein